MTLAAPHSLMTAPKASPARAEFDAQPSAVEVAIAVAGCGACHTELGYYPDGVPTNQPLALGYAVSGRVVAAGTGARSWLGKAVIVPGVLLCGDCDLCLRGPTAMYLSQECPGNNIRGGYESHILMPARGLCEVDENRLAAAGITLAQVSTVAGALSTSYQAIRCAEVERGDVAIVIGVGGLAGYCAQTARAFGATVVAVDVAPRMLESLVADGGAELALNAREHDGDSLKEAVQDFAKERGLRSTEWKIFECSGTAAGQDAAFRLLVQRATLSVVGFTTERVDLRLSSLMQFNARAIGSWGCEPEFYPAALDLVLDGWVRPSRSLRRTRLR